MKSMGGEGEEGGGVRGVSREWGGEWGGEGDGVWGKWRGKGR